MSECECEGGQEGGQAGGGEGGRSGYSTKNKNPTRQCGEIGFQEWESLVKH